MSGIRAERVTVRYGTAPALSDVDLAVPAGGWTAVVGPNGSGKSSLMKALAGTVPFGGTVLLDGQELAGLGPRRLARLVALVPQEPVVPERMRVRDYVGLGRTAHLGLLGGAGAEDRATCDRAIARMDLGAAADHLIATLSGGEQQRAVLARALAQEAPILLLDEATSALDLRRQHDVLEAVDELRRELGLTVVSAMHDLTLAGQYAEALLLLEQGRAVAHGTPEEVLCEELLTRHYDVPVRVLDHADARIVVGLRHGGA
jgi:iron complex transport system ATP-binding protein